MSSESQFKEWVCPDCGETVLSNGPGIPCGGVNHALAVFYGRPFAHEEGIKHDSGKPRTELLPAGALLEVARVLEHGAKKYGDHNWKKVQPRDRYVGALLRHLFAWMEGEKLDKESGLNHIYHAACCALFLAQWEHEGEK